MDGVGDLKLDSTLHYCTAMGLFWQLKVWWPKLNLPRLVIRAHCHTVHGRYWWNCVNWLYLSHAPSSYKLEWLIHGAKRFALIKTWAGIYRSWNARSNHPFASCNCFWSSYTLFGSLGKSRTVEVPSSEEVELSVVFLGHWVCQDECDPPSHRVLLLLADTL
jgi:hypothetical protein